MTWLEVVHPGFGSIQHRGLRIELRHQPSGVVEEPELPQHAWHIRVGGFGKISKRSGREGVDGDLLPGSSSFVPAGKPLRWSVDCHIRRLVILLDASLFNSQTAERHSPALRESPPSYDPAIDGFVGLLGREWNGAAAPSASFLDAFAMMLVLHTRGMYADGSDDDRMPAVCGEFAELQRFIDDNLGERITVAGMAEAIARSPHEMARMLKSQTRLTPHQYVIARRIERAKRLLKEGETALSDIAFRCGFSSQSHFSATFGKHIGVSPKAFRKIRA